MPLYELFKDEAEFRERFVKPLLNRLGITASQSSTAHRNSAKTLSFQNSTAWEA